MGKEWLYWGGGGASNSEKKKRSRDGGGVIMEEGSSTTPGCMCAVFQFWNLRHLPFSFPHHQARPSLSPDISDIPVQDDSSGHRKGLEAPRNSLELNYSCILETASSSSTVKNDENLNIPNMGIRIKTNIETKSPRASISNYWAKNDDILLLSSSSSEGNTNYSPGIKPPNLVARLMGLDLLPEQTGSPSSFSRQSSPSLSNRSLLTHPRSHDHDVSGTFSLPETPRISLARKSDVDHHRLSLQCSKENIDESIFGFRKMVRKDLEEESGSQYAKRIVKMMKEKVSRKVGVDITNTISINRQDNNLVVLKPKKMANGLRTLKEDSSSSNQSTPACSSRLSFLDNKKKSVSSQVLIQKREPMKTTSQTLIQKPEPIRASQTLIQKPESVSLNQTLIRKLKSVRVSEKTENVYDGTDGSVSRENPRKETHKPIRVVNLGKKEYDVIRNKKEEAFICSSGSSVRSNVLSEKKMKKNPPLKELTSNNSSVPTLVHKRKDLSLPPVTHLHDKELAEESDVTTVKRNTQQLPSCSSRSYNKEMLATKLFGQSEEYYHYYIQRILKRIGIDKDTPVSLAKWYSPAQPIDPSVFHYLELFNPTGFGPSRLNRKLVFHLVDELLVEILNLNSWGVVRRETFCGSELIDVLCKKIGEFPGADCQVLEDIDALIETDFRKFECFDDSESVVIDIERDIINNIMEETVMGVYDVGHTSKM